MTDTPDMPDTTLTGTRRTRDPEPSRRRRRLLRRPATRSATPRRPGVRSRSAGRPAQFEARIANPANRRRLSIIVVGTGLAGASRGRDPRRGRLRREVVLLPGLAPTRALDRRPGRDQRRQELQGRRRLGLPALLRHHQGRRLPLARVQRLPAGRGQPRTSSTSAWRRVCRSPASTAGCSTTGPSAAYRCPAPSTPAVRPASSCCIGAYQALERQVAAGTVRTYTRHEMLELIVVDGRARGIIVRDMVTGEIETYFADVVVLASGGYGNVFFLSTNAMGCNVTATLAGAPQGRADGQPLLHADPPDLHPGGRRAPVEAHADERVAAQRRPDLGAQETRCTPTRTRGRSPRTTATTTSSGSTRRSATWSLATSPPGRPRTCATRAAASVRRSTAYDAGSTSTSPTPSSGWGATAIEEQVRQPLRHVRPDHGRGPLRGADADLPRRALRDGRVSGSTTTCSRRSRGSS